MGVVFCLFVLNAVFVAVPPYGWLTVVNAVAAIAALVLLVALWRDGK